VTLGTGWQSGVAVPAGGRACSVALPRQRFAQTGPGAGVSVPAFAASPSSPGLAGELR